MKRNEELTLLTFLPFADDRGKTRKAFSTYNKVAVVGRKQIFPMLLLTYLLSKSPSDYYLLRVQICIEIGPSRGHSPFIPDQDRYAHNNHSRVSINCPAMTRFIWRIDSVYLLRGEKKEKKTNTKWKGNNFFAALLEEQRKKTSIAISFPSSTSVT